MATVISIANQKGGVENELFVYFCCFVAVRDSCF